MTYRYRVGILCIAVSVAAALTGCALESAPDPGLDPEDEASQFRSQAIADDDAVDRQQSATENLPAVPRCYYDKPSFGGPLHVARGQAMSQPSSPPCPYPGRVAP